MIINLKTDNALCSINISLPGKILFWTKVLAPMKFNYPGLKARASQKDDQPGFSPK
jgi:hypothetical protein